MMDLLLGFAMVMTALLLLIIAVGTVLAVLIVVITVFYELWNFLSQ